ncbi:MULTISPECIES: MarR family winged helix-turn-helix transcriptional regulator [Kordiimonas]|jgi:DNA-binding MarR family transcriptional regulator|uniref:MarR family winged helix-turn-helix transcriptional regulator n=1 Tax=Kordiimonas TaxID=288021 RepID=UPI002579E13E|nr:MarR family winged helix-turn-helix transcriptional regulator [Kordiimonas sp. UBA4487]
MNDQDIIEQLRQDVAGQCACQKIRKASRTITRRYDDALKPFGLTGNQFTMLTIISLADKVTLSRLAEIIGMERTTLIRNLKPLERAGLVTIAAEESRRAKHATISSQGLNTLSKALPVWRNTQASLKADLGDKTWQVVHQGLDAIS